MHILSQSFWNLLGKFENLLKMSVKLFFDWIHAFAIGYLLQIVKMSFVPVWHKGYVTPESNTKVTKIEAGNDHQLIMLLIFK